MNLAEQHRWPEGAEYLAKVSPAMAQTFSEAERGVTKNVLQLFAAAEFSFKDAKWPST